MALYVQLLSIFLYSTQYFFYQLIELLTLHPNLPLTPSGFFHLTVFSRFIHLWQNRQLTLYQAEYYSILWTLNKVYSGYRYLCYFNFWEIMDNVYMCLKDLIYIGVKLMGNMLTKYLTIFLNWWQHPTLPAKTKAPILLDAFQC